MTIPASELDPLLTLLSQDEHHRATRFVFEKDRTAYVACRASLRKTLAGYLTTRPSDICFDYSANGKPRLAEETDLRFNVSHSGTMAIFAITRACEIGVDIEFTRPTNEVESIAKKYFSGEEFADLMSLPEADRQSAFFRCWTRKEAYIKATGEGLSASLGRFQVTLLPHQVARFVHINNDQVEAANWTLQDLLLGPAFEAAVAYRAAPKEIRFMLSPS